MMAANQRGPTGNDNQRLLVARGKKTKDQKTEVDQRFCVYHFNAVGSLQRYPPTPSGIGFNGRALFSPVSPSNQQLLVLIASWSSLIGCHWSCRPRTNKKGPTIVCLSFGLLWNWPPYPQFNSDKFFDGLAQANI